MAVSPPESSESSPDARASAPVAGDDWAARWDRARRHPQFWLFAVGATLVILGLGLFAATCSGGGGTATTPESSTTESGDTTIDPTTPESPESTVSVPTTEAAPENTGPGTSPGAFDPVDPDAPLPDGVDGPVIDVTPDDDVAAMVAEADEGTVFRFAPGTYEDEEIVPLNGQSFLGLNQAVLDGSGTGEGSAAFSSAAEDVTVIGFEITNYKPCSQCGAVNAQIGASDNAPREFRSLRWHLESLEVHHNDGVGINIGPFGTVTDVRIHNQGRLGITSHGGRGITVQNCEIHNNNTENYNPQDEGGGSKFKYTFDLEVRNCHFHDNFGYGIWTDIDNFDSLIEDNLVENETWACIAHEVSFAAIIRNNTVRNCGTDGDAWLFKAGIQVQNSPDVLVENNTVENSFNGISLIMQDRSGDTQYQPGWVLERATVRNNTVTNSGQSGAVDDRLDPTEEFGSVPIPDTVVFEDNTWVAGLPDFEDDLDIGDDAEASRQFNDFRWGSRQLDWDTWQGELGHDADGSFEPRAE